MGWRSYVAVAAGGCGDDRNGGGDGDGDVNEEARDTSVTSGVVCA